MPGKNTLRPLFITNSFAHGGAEHHAVTLLNRLSERGHQCHAAFIKDQRAQLERLRLPETSNILGLDARRYLDRDALHRLAVMLEDVQPSVIIAANEYSLLYATLARRRARLSVPIVVTYHSTKLRTLKERLQMQFYRWFFWFADCAVFVCETQRRFWRRRAVLARRNEVIFNGIDTAAFQPAQADALRSIERSDLDIGQDDFVIGIAAGLRPEKNHRLLVDAISQLRNEGIPAVGLLIGDGETRRQIMQHARELGVDKYLLITGYQSDVRPYLNLCDVAVLCSTTETLSLAAIEAMALGKPFVHSDVGGAAELIYTGWNGFLFPSGDAAAFVARLRLLADPKRARVMGLNARQAVENRFSERTMVDRYEQLLHDLTSANDKGLALSVDAR
jgi:glycosyltransferase involved in cell wall biosynthesis